MSSFLLTPWEQEDIAGLRYDRIGQSVGAILLKVRAVKPETSEHPASHSVYEGILHALETGAVIPGQRLVESELAEHFGVGRNAVREAMQLLAARGVIDLRRNHSASIRQMEIDEVQEVLDVAGLLLELLFSSAARKFDPAEDGPILKEAVLRLKAAHADGDEVLFSRARRGIYRIMLRVAGNRELIRILPSIGTHIMNAKYQSRMLQNIRMRNYEKMCEAVMANDAKRAAQLARKHNEDMRGAMRERAQLLDSGSQKRKAW